MAALDFQPARPVIPLLDGRDDPVAILPPGSVAALQSDILGKRGFTLNLYMKTADFISRRWLARTQTRLLPELRRIRDSHPVPGLYAINTSYDWACTAFVADQGSAPILRRTLDWPFPGLGRRAIVLCRKGPAGEYFDVTWPGAVGVLTANAPGRFAASLNQAPMRRRFKGAIFGPGWTLDLIRNAWTTWRRPIGEPPLHLLRRVFDEARDFDAALKLIAEAPVTRPALFALAGIRPGETAIIEREETVARVFRGALALANDWREPRPGWQARPCALEDPAECSFTRMAAIEREAFAAETPFAWAKPPVVNWNTRLAVELSAASGLLRAQGYEPDPGSDASARPATAVLEISGQKQAPA